MKNEKKPIDRETKIMLLAALKRGYFTDNDINLLREKYNEISRVTISYVDFSDTSKPSN